MEKQCEWASEKEPFREKRLKNENLQGASYTFLTEILAYVARRFSRITWTFPNDIPRHVLEIADKCSARNDPECKGIFFVFAIVLFF